jgi:hypothetical protein
MATASKLLAAFPAEPAAVHCWLQTVLPLATDVEVVLQERCVELFREQVLARLEAAAKRPAPEAAKAVGRGPIAFQRASRNLNGPLLKTRLEV